MRLRSRAVAIAGGRAVTRASSLLVALVLVRLLDKTSYGLFRQVELVAMVVVVFFGLRLPTSLYYFLPRCEPEGQRRLLSQTVSLALAQGALMSLAMYLGAGLIAAWFNSPGLARLLRTFCLFPPALLLLRLPPPWMIGIGKPVRCGVYSGLAGLARLVPAVVLGAVGAGVGGLLVGITAAAWGVAIVGLLDMYRSSGGALRPPGLRSAADQLLYVLPLMAAGVVHIVNKQFDRFVIATVFDVDRYAVYVNGAIELPIVYVVTHSLSHAIMPDLVRLGAEEKLSRALALWHRSIRKCALIMYPAFAFCAMASRDLILLAFGVPYADARWPFLVYLLELPVQITLYGIMLRAVRQTRPIAVASVMGLVTNVGVTLSLVYAGRGSMLAFVGPSVGTVLALAVANGYLLARIRRRYNVVWAGVMPWTDLLRILALCVLAGVVGFLLPLDGWVLGLRLAVRTASYGAVLLGLLLLTGTLRPDEKRILVRPLRWLRLKGRNERS